MKYNNTQTEKRNQISDFSLEDKRNGPWRNLFPKVCLNINVCQIISFDQELKGETQTKQTKQKRTMLFCRCNVDKRGGMRLHNEFYLDNMAQPLHFATMM